jgi:ABC transporter ATM
MLPRLSTFSLRTTATKHVWQNHFNQRVFAQTPQRASLYSTSRKPLLSWNNHIPKRVFTTSKQSTTIPKTNLAVAEKKLTPPAIPAAVDNASNTKRNATDWAIIKQLMKYIWPKNDAGVKTRVVIALSLLIGGKVNRYKQSIAKG